MTQSNTTTGDPDRSPESPDPVQGYEGTDGRTMRRRRNRDAVIAALVGLIREGDLSPTVAKIADRAAVSHRSIFRYFDDLNDLSRAAIESELRRALLLGALPDPGQGGLHDRIEAMITTNLAILEQTHLLARVAQTKAIAIPEVDRGIAMVHDFRREQLGHLFAPELDVMDPARREAILTALTSVVGFDSYDMQLRRLDLTPDEIGNNWRIALRTDRLIVRSGRSPGSSALASFAHAGVVQW